VVAGHDASGKVNPLSTSWHPPVRRLGFPVGRIGRVPKDLGRCTFRFLEIPGRFSRVTAAFKKALMTCAGARDTYPRASALELAARDAQPNSSDSQKDPEFRVDYTPETTAKKSLRDITAN
jgi:hypothetical protein